MLFDPGCSNCGCPSPGDGTPCIDCPIPDSDLTLTYTNSIQGSRSIPLPRYVPGVWTSACFNQITFTLSCFNGALGAVLNQYSGGSCPTGFATPCSTSGVSPGLSLTAKSCDPLMLEFKPTSCPALSSLGYTKFVVTK